MRPVLAGATVINVVVDVAGLLVLLLRLGGNAHTALATPQEAAVRAWVVLNVRHTPSASQDGVRPIVQVFRYDRLMLALVYLSAITKVPVIKRILQNEGQPRDMDAAVAF